MRIVWTEQAQEDLEKIYQFWRPKNEAYAARLYNSLLDEADVLLMFPKGGGEERLLSHRAERFRSWVVKAHYKLIYTIEKADIVIHAVWDCRQNPADLAGRV